MSISLASLRSSRDDRPPRVLIYGVPGVGKTTFACSAPDPVAIWTEEGAGMLDVQGFPLASRYDEVLGALGALYTEDHSFRTVLLDSLDALEPLVWQKTCDRNGWNNIEQPGYGKGYVATLDDWRLLFQGLDALRTEKGMTVVLIAHAEARRFENPETDPYDRYEIKLHKRASALAQEHSDVIAFANYRVMTKATETGFGQKVVRGMGSGERLLHLEERPAWVAKNRFAMPAELPLSWADFAAHVPTLAGPPATTPEPAQPATDAPAQPEEETEHATA